MKVVLIGATGMAGSQILKELIERGHEIRAVVRSSERIFKHDQVTPYQADINDSLTLIPILTDQDAVISAVHFTDTRIECLIQAMKKAEVKRYLMVGGAGGLYLPNGERLVDSEKFPKQVRPEALAGIDILEKLRQENELEWTVLAPSMLFRPKQRTQKFRLGKDDLLFNQAGESEISVEDYAIALVDELECPQYIQQRFTVGY